MTKNQKEWLKQVNSLNRFIRKMEKELNITIPSLSISHKPAKITHKKIQELKTIKTNLKNYVPTIKQDKLTGEEIGKYIRIKQDEIKGVRKIGKQEYIRHPRVKKEKQYLSEEELKQIRKRAAKKAAETRRKQELQNPELKEIRDKARRKNLEKARKKLTTEIRSKASKKAAQTRKENKVTKNEQKAKNESPAITIYEDTPDKIKNMLIDYATEAYDNVNPVTFQDYTPALHYEAIDDLIAHINNMSTDELYKFQNNSDKLTEIHNAFEDLAYCYDYEIRDNVGKIIYLLFESVGLQDGAKYNTEYNSYDTLNEVELEEITDDIDLDTYFN